MSRNAKIGIFIALAVITTTFTFYFWQIFKAPNLLVNKEENFTLLIPEKATFETVMDSLKKHDVIHDQMSFMFLSRFLNYKKEVKPGRYIITPKSSNKQVIDKLKEGKQDPVKLTFNNIRLKSDLIKRIGPKFAFGTEQLEKALNSPEVAQKYGLDTNTIVSIFLPNTYDIYWTTSTEKFLDRMHSEYKRFWNDERLAKAKAINLTPAQVAILASIVEEEQARKVDERPKVAGLYLNRLQANMPLQADPTVKFALQDFGLKRILHGHLQIDSPYNTYKHTGLPPGPIRLADLKSLEAVLNYEKHDYIYMCAKDDLSGYHAFANNYQEHLKNARAYQTALNKLNIK